MVICKKFVCGELFENCYVVFDNQTKDAVVIDPGDKLVFKDIMLFIESEKLNVKMVLLLQLSDNIAKQ